MAISIGATTYDTIQDAVDAAAPGATITIDAGVYQEQVTIPSDKTGISINAAEGAILLAPPVADLATTTVGADTVAPVLSILADNVDVNGLTIDGVGLGALTPPPSSEVTGVLVTGDGVELSNVTVQNFDIASADYPGGAAIFAAGGDGDPIDFTVENSTIDGVPRYGVNLVNVRADVTDTTISAGDATDVQRIAINLAGAGAGSIARNTILGFGRDSGSDSFDSVDAGIRLGDTDGVVVQQNTIVSAAGEGIGFVGIIGGAFEELSPNNALSILSNVITGSGADGEAFSIGIALAGLTNSIITGNAYSDGAAGYYFVEFGEGNVVGANSATSIAQGGLFYLGSDEPVADDVTGTNEADVILTGNGADFVNARGGDDSVAAGAGDDTVLGGAGNDSIDGDSGADSLAGGFGDDSITGGAGDDTVLGDDGADILRGDGDNDLIAGGAGADDIDGGDGNDTVSGGADNDVIFGGSGEDSLSGGGGADFIDGGTGDDTLDGAGREDELFGGSGDDLLLGGNGADTLDGGDGNDTMLGGRGDDVYLVSSADDTIVELSSDGFDTVITDVAVYTLGDNLEGLVYVGSAPYDLTGNGLANDILISEFSAVDGVMSGLRGSDTLTGFDGNDTLDGGAGNDTMYGGGGDDVYIVDRLGDVVLETGNGVTGGGFDLIGTTGVGIDLRDYVDIEAAAVVASTSTFSVDLSGDDSDNELYGNDGDNLIEGQGGSDLILAYAGSDTVVGGAGADAIDAGAGSDTVNGGDGNDDISGGSGADTLNGDDGDDIVSGDDGADTLRGNAGNDLLLGGAGNDVITGGADADELLGEGGNDQLTGGSGDDELNGGEGADTMAGGSGDDVYLVDNVGDVVSENAGEGFDIVVTDLSDYTLGANVEAVTYFGIGNTTLTGNGLDNELDAGLFGTGGSLAGLGGADLLIGTNFADTLNGGTGADTMYGGGGDDTYYVDNAGDAVIEAAPAFDLTSGGTDLVLTTVDVNLAAFAGVENASILNAAGTSSISLTGSSLNNTLTGDAGANTLNGVGGNDVLIGLGGNDTLMGGFGFDSLSGGDGNDVLMGEDGDDTITGGLGNDTISGGTSADVITGGTGTDSIDAGAGNDSVSGDVGNDTIAAGGGRDTVTGGDGNDVITGGNGPDSLSGGTGDDTISGDSGRDTLDGGAGADLMTGGTESDFYTVDNAGDVVVELANEGSNDTITTTLSTYVLVDNVESGSFVGTGAFSLTGNAGGNTLDAFVNVAGGVLSGLEGNDALFGSAGDDTLDGGAGADTFFGGSGDDVFLYDEATDTGVGAGSADLIQDFTSGEDIIDLSAIASFDYIGSDAFTGTGPEIRSFVSGALTVVQFNTGSDTAADGEINLLGVFALDDADFGIIV